MSNTLEATLNERGAKYGAFASHAEITQALKRFYRGELVALPENIRKILAAKWAELSADQQEALDMQAHKDGRIFNGDHNYADSWVDKAGYNKLVADRLTTEDLVKAQIDKLRERVTTYDRAPRPRVIIHPVATKKIPAKKKARR